MSKKLITYEIEMTGDFRHTFEVQAKDKDDAYDKATEECSNHDKDVYLNWDWTDIGIDGSY